VTNFQEERAKRAELRRIKRLMALSVVLILFGLISILSSCVAVETCELEAKPVKVKYSCTFK